MKIKIFNVLDSPLMARVVLVGVILSLMVGSYSYFKVQRLTGCLADYNNRSQASQQARAVLAQRQSDSTTDILVSVATAKTRAQAQSAVDRYLNTVQTLNEEKRDHPIPAPPSQVCK